MADKEYHKQYRLKRRDVFQTIEVKRITLKRMQSKGKYNESYDDIINRAFDEIELAKEK